jgi:hypothetical protein
MMAELSIERLSLHLTGLSEGDGRRLTRMIADGLAAASGPIAGEHRDSMQSKIKPRPGSSLQEISDQVVADLLSQLERSL